MNEIIKKYENYHKKKLYGGLRCKTYLLSNEEEKVIYQVYNDYAMYQAKKKYDVTKLIKNSIYCNQIPEVYDYGISEQFSWLVTEFKEGITLEEFRKTDNGFNLKSIAKELTEVLLKIHSIKYPKKFGWITDNEVFSNDCFYQYLESEIKRFTPSLESYFDEKTKKNIIEKAHSSIEIIKKKTNGSEAVINWYDLNPNNIIIDNKGGEYKLSAIVDPGGARYGIREWDLAFLKYEVCASKEEFEAILKHYQKENKIDIELIDLLGVIIEIDDIVIRISDKINLTIPYCSNFSDIIKKIHRKNDV